MGGDGGVAAIQRRFFRGYKDPSEASDGKNVKESQRNKTRVCALTGQRLTNPIVACELGYLYNKEALLNAMLENSLGQSFSHIRGLRDVVTLRLSPNPSFDESKEVSGEYSAMFVCPVTLTEFNGNHPFVVIWTTGHVLSERAVREMSNEELQAEYGPFTDSDIVKLLPKEEEFQNQVAHMESRRARSKKDKKESGGKRKKIDVGNDGAAVDATDGGSNGKGVDDSKKVGVEGGEKKMKLKDFKSGSGAGVSAGVSGGVSGGGVKGVSNVLNPAATLAKTACDAVHEQEGKSQIFKSLFHTSNSQGGSGDKAGGGDASRVNERDLFIGLGSLRYTLS